MAGCTDLQNDLSEYIDGELPASARTALEAHLQSCAACRAALADLKNVAGSLATLPKVKAPAGFAAKISREIRTAAKPAAKVVSIGTARAPRTWLKPSLMSAAALVAAAVLVFAVGPQLQKQQQSQTGVAMNEPKRTTAAPVASAPAPVVAREANELGKVAAPAELGDANKFSAGEERSGGLKQTEERKQATRAEFKAGEIPADGKPGAVTENRSRGAANGKADGGIGAPQALASSPPPQATGAPAADAKSEERLKALDARPGYSPVLSPKNEVAAAQTEKVAAGNSAFAGQGGAKGGKESKGRDEVLRQDASDKSKDKAAQEGAGGGATPSEKPATAARRATEEESRKAPGEKKATNQPETAKAAQQYNEIPGAPRLPQPAAADPGFGAPVRLTLKSENPQALAELVRATAKSAGAIVASPKPSGPDFQKDRKAHADPQANKKQDRLAAQAQPLTLTFSVPASKREVFMKEIAALKLKTAGPRAEAKEPVADKSAETLEKSKRNAGLAQTDDDSAPAKKAAPAARNADAEEADEAPSEQKKNGEELVQIIVVLETEE